MKYLGVCYLLIIVLIDEIRAGLNSELEQWRHILESTKFRLSRSKIEYLNRGFSAVGGSGEEVNMGGVAIPRAKKFRYLGSIIKEKGDIDEVSITVGWQK